jgi:MFS family permease
MASEMRTIETDVPARLDRLPWSGFHRRVIIGLGTVWILDGLEVTIVGNIASRLTEPGSGITLSAGQIGTAAAFYVAGACLGALFFGQLTDRFGRKKLFMLTLGIYLIATVATAFAFAPWYFFLFRFITGTGIGGEYAAINSAIDELIPARVRGRVDLLVNGSYWGGAAIGALGTLLLLDQSIFAINVGWRLAFGIGAVFGVAILIVRRHVPESPRWLFIHGRDREADEVVREIEHTVEEETGESLPEPEGTITVRQRKTIPFRLIARTAVHDYPKRTVLGLALFVGQAFLYNAITFDLGTLLGTYFGVSSGSVPYYFAVFAVGNLLGPLTLGRLFDTVGRKPMITFAYAGSAAMSVVLTILFVNGSLTAWTFTLLVGATFFIASAGTSAAYLTVSEIFPMETRALAIAFFYAVGTGLGGITGPLLFGHLIASGDRGTVAIGFYIGAGVMLLGALAEALFGVKAEGRSLEDIAQPLTAQEAEEDEAAPPAPPAPPSRRQRYRPGPHSPSSSPGMTVTFPLPPQSIDVEKDRLAALVAEHGPIDRAELARLAGARLWGPGRFSRALGEATAEGRIRRAGRSRLAPPG